jgi:hypothetical protein
MSGRRTPGSQIANELEPITMIPVIVCGEPGIMSGSGLTTTACTHFRAPFSALLRTCLVSRAVPLAPSLNTRRRGVRRVLPYDGRFAPQCYTGKLREGPSPVQILNWTRLPQRIALQRTLFVDLLPRACVIANAAFIRRRGPKVVAGR